PQRSYLQIIGSMVPLLVIGTLLTVAAPAPPGLGVEVAALVGLLASGVLSWGRRHQIRLAKRAAGSHGAADSTSGAISERGRDHYPVRDARAGRVGRSGRAGRDEGPVRE